MSIELLDITFNHDSGNATTDALNIRRNAKRFVDIPEWRRGITDRPEESVAAYAIHEIGNNPITIQLRLARTDPSLATVEVRAVQPPIPWFWLASAWGNVASWGLLLETQVNVLGEVKARPVVFRPDSTTDFETFELRNHRLPYRGVGVHRVVWRWQYRSGPASPWVDFAVTRHQIYTVLQAPTEPWLREPYDEHNLELPWTDVLDYACRWARLARAADEAAALITRAVYGLGKNHVLEYGCPILAPTVYAFPYFQCTEFLKRLRGDFGLGQYCNCSDCATIVSTFANALGCDLWQSRMRSFGTSFPVNPIRAIGLTHWDTPCGLGFFGYHEVAWKGDCTENDEVFDACLEVDSTLPPYPPYTPLLPANLRFGGVGEGLYRDLLAARWGRHLCDPQPVTRQRRRVVPGAPGRMDRAVSAEPPDHLRRRYAFDAWAGSNRLEENLLVWRFGLSGDELPGWQIHSAREIAVAGAFRAVQSVWRALQAGPDTAVRIDVYECNSRLAAHAFLLQLLDEFQLPGLTRSEQSAPGDVTFTFPGDAGIVFSRANLVFWVLNGGRKLVPASEVAHTLDAQIVSKPQQAVPAEILPEWQRLSDTEPKLQVGAGMRLVTAASDIMARRWLLQPEAAVDMPAEPAAGLKLFSPTGFFRLENDLPVYVPEKPGPQRITVVATAPDRSMTTQDLALTAE